MNDLSHCSASESFALRVIGDDMAPEFTDGQVIIVDPGGKVSSGCFVIAKLGEEMIFRQLWISDERYRLTAWDAPGYGGSERIAAPTPNNYAGAVAALAAAAA